MTEISTLVRDLLASNHFWTSVAVAAALCAASLGFAFLRPNRDSRQMPFWVGLGLFCLVVVLVSSRA